jgi:hypothetical protein
LYQLLTCQVIDMIDFFEKQNCVVTQIDAEPFSVLTETALNGNSWGKETHGLGKPLKSLRKCCLC